MNICMKCGFHVEAEINPKLCPDCKTPNSLRVLQAYCDPIHEKIVVEGIGLVDFISTVESQQDIRMMRSNLETYLTTEPSEEEIRLWNQFQERGFFGKIRTPAPSQEEVEDWRKWDNFLENVDVDKVKTKYKVHFFREEEEGP